MFRNFIILCLLIMTSTVFSAVQVHVDKTEVVEGEALTLVISSNDHLSLSPDLNPLRKDFDIVGTSQNSRFNYINGKASMETQWQISLLPRNAGDIEIPSINVGNEKTPAQLIHVVRNSPTTAPAQTHNPNVFIESSVMPKELYVQEQIVYNVKLFFNRTIENPYLTPPELSDAKIVQNGQDIVYTNVKNGKYYRVLERSYLITPQKSGSFQIEPAVLKGYMETNNGLVDPYGFPSASLRPIKIIGPALSINVNPKPANFVGQWLPAKKVLLSESFEPSPPIFKVGEPVSRIIEVTAEGATGDQIPAIVMTSSPTLNVYPDRPQRETDTTSAVQIGKLKQKIIFIPTAPGKMTLPAVTIRWWNTRTQKEQVATLPAKKITVQPASLVNNPSTSSPMPKMVVKDNVPQNQAIVEKNNNYFWPILAGLLLVVWLVTVWLWRRQLKSPRSKVTDYPPVSYKEILKNLKAACLANSSKQARILLLEWANLHWKDHPIHSLSDIAQLLETEPSSQLLAEIMQLEANFYSKNHGFWNGELFWNTFVHYLSLADKENKEKPTDPLPPLYCSNS